MTNHLQLTDMLLGLSAILNVVLLMEYAKNRAKMHAHFSQHNRDIKDLKVFCAFLKEYREKTLTLSVTISLDNQRSWVKVENFSGGEFFTFCDKENNNAVSFLSCYSTELTAQQAATVAAKIHHYILAHPPESVHILPPLGETDFHMQDLAKTGVDKSRIQRIIEQVKRSPVPSPLQSTGRGIKNP